MKNKADSQLINEEIRAFKVRVISQDGENLGVLSRDEALDMARRNELDLVLLSDKDEVPLVKIMDFGKSQYAKKKKMSESKKKQKVIKIKEVKMRPKIGVHDYLTKINQGASFLQSGHKLKVTLVFSGREIDGMRAVGADFFDQVDKSLVQKGLADVTSERDDAIGRSKNSVFWSRIYYLKTKK